MNRAQMSLYGAKRIFLLFILIALITTFESCRSFGPHTIVKDRFNYTTVLSESWKEQMLLNIVRLRYGDAPIFLDVSSVINSYELSGRADISGNMNFAPGFGSGSGIGVNGTYANRPTISYSPLSGEKFAENLMTPIPVFPIFTLIQSGYPIDLVFRLMVQSINGLENRHIGENFTNTQFYHLIKILKEIQDEGALHLRLTKEDGIEMLVLVLSDSEDDKVDAQIRETIHILGLDSDIREFYISYGELQQERNEIVILSRSILKVLNELSMNVEVPYKHVDENRVNPSISEKMVDGERIPRLVNIYFAEQEPADAFVAVNYGNNWYWIDNKDLITKKIFSFMMFTFSLVEKGGKEATPFITVPVR